MKRFAALFCLAVMLLTPVTGLANEEIEMMKGLINRLFGFESLNTPVPSEALVVWPTAEPTPAPEVYRPDEGIIIQDDLLLLTADEQRALADVMQPLTRYGAVAFWTTDESGATDSKAMRYYDSMIGGRETDGVLFMIDMDRRMLYVFTRGDTERVVTRSDAYAITTDNSGYATRKEYFNCACAVFGDILTLLEGHTIASPMRTVCCILMGCAMGMTCAAFIASRASVQPRLPRKETTAMLNIVTCGTAVVGGEKLISVTRHKNSSDSSGSGCSSGCSSGGSSCSSCSSCGSGGGSSF